MQIEAYCASQNASIVGSYYADATLETSGDDKDKQPPFAACRLADRVAENCGESVLAIVRNSELVPETEGSALQLFTLSDGKWRASATSGNDAVAKEARELAWKCVRDKLYFQIVDFDTHFDDVTADFRNTFVNNQAAKGVQSKA